MPQLLPHTPVGGRAMRAMRRAQAIVPDQLERHLLRRSIGILAEDRTSCADCGRVPLIGERVHLYADAEIVCELCRPLRREPPVSTEPVRHSEYGHTVKVTRSARS
ncbi:MAG TPA: hypothetical protein VHW26_00325 [Solirubrobacteraceae bacterium]|jgi:hypothetical protein|nr:hypothetical protein [Solirubrobacteraceae bacterium]